MYTAGKNTHRVHTNGTVLVHTGKRQKDSLRRGLYCSEKEYPEAIHIVYSSIGVGVFMSRAAQGGCRPG